VISIFKIFKLNDDENNVSLMSSRSEIIDPKITERFLELGKFLAPELLNEKGELEVLSVQVGLRPHRKGGIRLELEKLQDKALGEISIVHDYGHSHGGLVTNFFFC